MQQNDFKYLFKIEKWTNSSTKINLVCNHIIDTHNFEQQKTFQVLLLLLLWIATITYYDCVKILDLCENKKSYRSFF